jgi:hypothetical protein
MNILFVNNVKHLRIIFDWRIKLRVQLEKIEAKAFRTFIRVYSLFKSERLSANITLTHHKAIIRTIMTYACPAWEFAADNNLITLQRLQNKVLRTTGKHPRRTLVHDVYMAFKLPYVHIRLYNKIMQATSRCHTKSWKILAIMDKAKPDTEDISGLNLAAVKHTIVQVTRLPL